ncbi:nucleolar protein 16-like [Leptonychotes weddellii]|uniref:Nucleolar protein 16 n=1 Tax=Leptonychotes weddellii TaxID=9713 RepID=A0A7F8QPP7_LEPWE|nr:nucleolar protein 16-like [Leptonychotes weddellii]
MPKAKGKTRRQKFGYNVNRKRLNRNARRKAAPRIECSHIRHAWDHARSVRQNLAEMGLAMDPNKAVPLRKRKVKAMEVDVEERPKELVRKPYVLNGGCWPHSSRSPSCTVRARKGPQVSSFYRWKKTASEGRRELVWGSQS